MAFMLLDFCRFFAGIQFYMPEFLVLLHRSLVICRHSFL